MLRQRKTTPVEYSVGDFVYRTDNKKYNKQWWDNFKKLYNYKQQTGDVNVPIRYPADPALAKWVRKQRLNINMTIRLQDGEEFRSDTARSEAERIANSEESGKRHDLLNSIGLVKSVRDQNWNRHLKEYVDFINDGNKTEQQADGDLSGWVRHTRNRLKAYHEGNSSPLTQNRVNELKAVGFCEDEAVAAGKQVYNTLWEISFKNLKLCKQEDGTFLPDRRLRRWICHQKEEYKQYQNGEDRFQSTKHTERFRRLADIGVDLSEEIESQEQDSNGRASKRRRGGGNHR